MFRPEINQQQLGALVNEMPDIDFARFLYCQHISSTYLAVGKFEHMLIQAMLLCDRVKLEKALGADISRWQQSIEKRKILRNSTIGSLISILNRHGIAKADVHYQKWIKGRRDYFVHRLFHDGPWPGETDVDGCQAMIRRLMALQIHMQRAERQIWRIFKRAGFVELDELEDGILVMNIGVYDVLDAEER